MSAAGPDGTGAALVVDRLTVTYPGAAGPVLREVSFTVPSGAGVLVVGPSGSGKSTLVAALAGVVPHTVDADVGGTVHVAGGASWADGPRATSRSLGLVQQDPLAQVCLDRVDAEVELALENRAWDPALVPGAAARALARVGAAPLAGRRTGELSGGECQRVAVAAAVAPDPAVLLLDEPTALLDPAGAREVGALVGGLAAGPTACLVVEHRLDDLRPLPALTAVLDAGRLVAFGPTGAVLGEHAAGLARAGCWLPLEHLLALAGAPAPLGDPRTDAWLADVARAGAGSTVFPGSTAPPGEADPTGGTVAPRTVLRAQGLAVHLGGPRGGRRRGRRAGGRGPGRPPVVDGVDLTLRGGEVVAVVGVNGSGKSTLLHGLAGLEETRGALETGRVAMVVQHPEHQLLARTVADEVAWTPRRAGLAPEAVDRAVCAALDRFGLADVADRSPYRLSGGQQRRLSLATAVVLPGDVLLADEPTFGLDRAGSAATGRALREVAASGGGVVLVSHDLTFVAQHADRVLVLAGGRPLALGPTDAVLADAALLARAGLVPGALLSWWAGTAPAARPPLRALLDGLDAAVERAQRPAGAAR
ncbi:ABC transporter ATP-binding protein [Cellulomonas sp. PhB143]|uniref:ABC transporter ATP-binding protein n=1 Tax=Cellulomonas sp. PhB143 TaxID=2485186 RepID=UPI000F498D42|nr:ABC transporter ATP-binding protein [Cellulomonas sp. PhB143]ROS74567.1 energy-coupling factor transport system ATP-binding protein [Cellulomonas sp. PhB143]